MTYRPDEEARWHLDKKVPISIIAVLLVQLSGGVWFMSKLESRVVALEAAQVAQHDRDEHQDRQVAEAIALVRASIEHMDNKLDRIIERAKQ
jgi:hypothetical protein